MTNSGQWKKLLYIQQDFPDNYVPPSFLEQLQTNGTIFYKEADVIARVKTWNYWNLVGETGVIVQQLSAILLFVSVFIHVYQHQLDATLLLVYLTLTTLVGLIAWNGLQLERLLFWRTGLLLLLIIMGLTPILRTLTVNTSSDSIWAIAACLLMTNFILHDYSTATHQRIM
jgi:phosphatidylinositol glycan class C protein